MLFSFNLAFPHLGVATRHLKFRIRVFFIDEMSSKTDEPHLSKALVFNLPLFLFLSVVAVLNVIYMYMYLSISINKSYKKEISIICDSNSLPFTIIDKGKAKQTSLCISSGKKWLSLFVQ